MQATDSKAEREQLQRILQSEALRHADQLRQLLAYLGEKSISGDTAGLKEFTIGLEALHKGGDYDPRKDATVRIQVGRLRTKLDEYARDEGKDDSLVASLPKGGFRVEFRRKSEATPAVLAQGEGRWKFAALALGALCTLLAANAVLGGRTKPVSGWTPEMKTLWGSFLEPERPLVLSLGSFLFYYIDEIVVRDWHVNREQDLHGSEKLLSIQKALRDKPLVPMQLYTGSGESAAAVLMTQLFTRQGKELNLRRGENLSWEDFKSGNVILVGAPKNQAQLKPLSDIIGRLNFVVENSWVLNRRPLPGERPRYNSFRHLESRELSGTTAVITKAPGLNQRGSILMLLAPDSEGVQAAAETIQSPALSKEILERVGGADAFQVLLDVKIQRNVPVNVKIAATRVLE